MFPVRNKDLTDDNVTNGTLGLLIAKNIDDIKKAQKSQRQP